jgi:HK97 family phage portal protein
MPTVRSLVSRVLSPLLRAVEGQARRGPFDLPISGGRLSAEAGQYLNWFQMGFGLTSGERSAIVERCISLYAATIASLPGTHWRANGRGGRDRVTNSALARILRAPNSYQTPSDFLLNAVRDLFANGNSYALCLRNERFEISEIHLMSPEMSAPQVAQTGDIFYRLAGNDVIERMLGGDQLIVPARDVLHIKLHNNRRYPRPLVGESPLVAALADIALGDALAQQQIQFLLNQARPSAVLSTDLVLDKDQVAALRDRWTEQSKGLHQGGVPILTAGLKVVPWTVPARDAQLVELGKLSAEKICYAFGIPLQLLGLGGAPLGSTEALMQFWLATGLGFALNHVELALDQLFGLRGEPEEYTELDTSVLLRAQQKDRIEALARGVQTAIYSPNEARAMENLDAVPFGDEPRVQAQQVMLSAVGAIPTAPVPPSAPAASIADYQDAVQRDIAALRARAHSANGATEPPRAVIRKVRMDGLQQPKI